MLRLTTLQCMMPTESSRPMACSKVTSGWWEAPPLAPRSMPPITNEITAASLRRTLLHLGGSIAWSSPSCCPLPMGPGRDLGGTCGRELPWQTDDWGRDGAVEGAGRHPHPAQSTATLAWGGHLRCFWGKREKLPHGSSFKAVTLYAWYYGFKQLLKYQWSIDRSPPKKSANLRFKYSCQKKYDYWS